MKCPHCNETLIMTDRQGVEIDYCRKCRGVWLERGELDKIVERNMLYNYSSNKEQFSKDYKQSSFDDDGYKNSPHYKHKKKRGFLEDLFDFD